MREIQRILQVFTELQEGDCWIGMNLQSVVGDLSAVKALQRIDKDSNCIWQLVNHIRYWRMTAVNRLNGKTDPPPFADMLMPGDKSEKSWKATLGELKESYLILHDAISKLSDPDLERKTPRGDQSFYKLLYGVLQHDSYHMGQMVLIKKFGK